MDAGIVEEDDGSGSREWRDVMFVIALKHKENRTQNDQRE